MKFCTCLVLSLGLLTANLHAVQFLPLSVEQLSAQAQLVIHGRVLSRTCLTDNAGRIHTRIELDIQEVWKGPWKPGRHTLVCGGGVLGERRTVVTGQAEFAVGEEVVVFAVFNDRGDAVTLGLRQGKFKVWTDTTTGQKLAANGFPHPPPPSAKNQATLAPSARTATVLALAELKHRVKEAKP